MIDLLDVSHPTPRDTRRRAGEAFPRPPGGHDTTELRWFASGSLPVDVRSWFTVTTAAREERCDWYLLDQDVDVGVKARGGQTLELKLRSSVDEVVDLGPGLRGTLEEWRKWSPADRVVDLPGRGRWVGVTKTVDKRRFAVDGTETTWQDVTSGAGCDVEVTQVGVGSVEAWTLAFAAFGPRVARLAALWSAWHTLTDSDTVPVSLAGLGPPMGYPQWLTSRHASMRVRMGSPR